MNKVERVREAVAGLPSTEYFQTKLAAGWSMVAVVWEREVQSEPKPPRWESDVPYGFRVALDCDHLEENPSERQAMMLMLDLFAQDYAPSKVADELNQRGFRTRSGGLWSQVSVFNMHPRLIELGPQIVSSPEWIERRKRA